MIVRVSAWLSLVLGVYGFLAALSVWGVAVGAGAGVFALLFPHGVRMTPQLLRDLQQWTELTRALAAHATP